MYKKEISDFFDCQLTELVGELHELGIVCPRLREFWQRGNPVAVVFEVCILRECGSLRVIVHKVKQFEQRKVDESQVLSDGKRLVAHKSRKLLTNDVDLETKIIGVPFLKVNSNLVVECVMHATYHVCFCHFFSVATEKVRIVFLGNVLHY